MAKSIRFLSDGGLAIENAKYKLQRGLVVTQHIWSDLLTSWCLTVTRSLYRLEFLLLEKKEATVHRGVD